MGKRSGKTKSKIEHHWKNPDGSKSCAQAGETVWVGGRTHFVGHSALSDKNERGIALDVLNERGAIGNRQIQAVRSMSDAFHRFEHLHRKSANLMTVEVEVDPMTVAALRLEVEFTCNSGMKVHADNKAKMSATKVNKSMIMSSHRWFITVLPLHIVQQVIHVSLFYRETFKSYEPVATIKSAPPPAVFSSIDCTEQNRPDIIFLLNGLFEVPFGVNAHVYSEEDDGIMQAVQEFKRSDKLFTLLPDDASPDDILDYIENQAGMIDMACCFWCEKNRLSTDEIFTCKGCKAVAYCGKECQTKDWKAYHKDECKKLANGTATRKQLGMEESRVKTLKRPGAKKCSTGAESNCPEGRC